MHDALAIYSITREYIYIQLCTYSKLRVYIHSSLVHTTYRYVCILINAYTDHDQFTVYINTYNSWLAFNIMVYTPSV